MNTYIDIDKVGRLVIPKELRERYGITRPGRLEVIDTGQGVLLKPDVQAPSVAHLANGFPVFRMETGADTNVDTTDLGDLVSHSRAERDSRNVTSAEAGTE
jgi:AbrB family looped-hinge helix DNA binding protein